jgi:hypothetical protein
LGHERTITVQLDPANYTEVTSGGRWFNVPTINPYKAVWATRKGARPASQVRRELVTGADLTPEEAIDYALKRGMLGRGFDSVDEAVAAAEIRSESFQEKPGFIAKVERLIDPLEGHAFSGYRVPFNPGGRAPDGFQYPKQDKRLVSEATDRVFAKAHPPISGLSAGQLRLEDQNRYRRVQENLAGADLPGEPQAPKMPPIAIPGGQPAPQWMVRAWSRPDLHTDENESVRTASGEVDGMAVLFPTIRLRPGGKLERLGMDKAFDEAIERGDYLEFGSQEEADHFSREFSNLLGSRAQDASGSRRPPKGIGLGARISQAVESATENLLGKTRGREMAAEDARLNIEDLERDRRRERAREAARRLAALDPVAVQRELGIEPGPVARVIDSEIRDAQPRREVMKVLNDPARRAGAAIGVSFGETSLTEDMWGRYGVPKGADGVERQSFGAFQFDAPVGTFGQYLRQLPNTVQAQLFPEPGRRMAARTARNDFTPDEVSRITTYMASPAGIESQLRFWKGQYLDPVIASLRSAGVDDDQEAFTVALDIMNQRGPGNRAGTNGFAAIFRIAQQGQVTADSLIAAEVAWNRRNQDPRRWGPPTRFVARRQKAKAQAGRDHSQKPSFDLFVKHLGGV